ncbi:polyprenol phosphomannose-dependent alpha 1,6 mannosyltransferase MptB [Tenacibaculum sp.]|uniref:polyprenol phosphomannose-dependent alpha 1,6 mannosyltransferase MptB n=1 Tax=Tenacibaculum sp. TaxID=1906242 RepID=UPI003AA944D2
MSFFKKHSSIILTLVSVVLYFLFAYTTERTEFNKLLFLWISLFTCYFVLLRDQQLSFAYLTRIAVLFRLVFLFATPNLSQDFYRFIWDGRMILEGLNPYLTLPQTFIEQNNYPINQANELYKGMGVLNGSHYTNYPPINQLCFFIAALFTKNSIIGSIIVMRVLIILADIGILYFGKKLLERLQLPVKNIFLYILNPFVIIELTGNLHFEPVMLFFLVWSIYTLQQHKWFLAGILLACSISVKLIPLLFLPLFFQWFVKGDISTLKGFKKLVLFHLTTIFTVFLLFLPFYSSELISNYTNSVGLWFRNFEFNASFYYVAREIGYLFRGYNEIAIIGKIIPVLTICFLLMLTFFKKNKSVKQLIVSMLLTLSCYYFLTTTMHPWYIATLLILSVCTQYRYAVLWSFVVILSYQAYANSPWKENLWLITLEYALLYTYFIWEVFIKRKPTQN